MELSTIQISSHPNSNIDLRSDSNLTTKIGFELKDDVKMTKSDSNQPIFDLFATIFDRKVD